MVHPWPISPDWVKLLISSRFLPDGRQTQVPDRKFHTQSPGCSIGRPNKIIMSLARLGWERWSLFFAGMVGKTLKKLKVIHQQEAGHSLFQPLTLLKFHPEKGWGLELVLGGALASMLQQFLFYKILPVLFEKFNNKFAVVAQIVSGLGKNASNHCLPLSHSSIQYTVGKVRLSTGVPSCIFKLVVFDLVCLLFWFGIVRKSMVQTKMFVQSLLG